MVRGAYFKWKITRLCGRSPVIRLPGAAQVAATDKFNDYYAIHVQHPSEDEFRTYKDLLSPGGVFVDVGANMGLTTVLAWKTGLASQIIAFEPTHRYAAVWHANIGRNGVKNAALYQCATGDKPGTFEFVIDPEAPLHNRLLLGGTLDRYEPEPNSQRVVESIRLVRLDDILSACGVSEVQLLKVDVEGAEPSVLRGAERLLARRAIKNILIEFIPEYMEEMGESIEVYVDHLIQYGFRFRAIEPDGSSRRHLSKDDLLHRRFVGLNIIAELIE